MNILFLEESLEPSTGGVERVTDIVARGLSTYYNYNCFFIYSKYENLQNDPLYKNRLKISPTQHLDIIEKEILTFISKNNIEIIISQRIDWKLINIYKQIKKQKPKIQIIYCLHLSPDYKKFYPKTWKSPIHEFFIKIKSKLQYGSYDELRGIYNICDKFVVLSNSFIPQFIKLYKIKNPNKLYSISNPRTFDNSIALQEVQKKENIVLIVARLNELQKNISAALNIWKRIQDYAIKNNWKLYIIGTGNDESFLREYTKQLKLQNVYFLGKQINVKAYYEKASIFMMTSKYEGFGMTLVEALQNGCVPIVYDNFSVLHDIIQDKSNGVIITSNNEQEFVNNLMLLMNDHRRRISYSLNGINSTQKFSKETICSCWNKLIKELYTR